MQLKIFPSTLSGTVSIPPSKSQTVRALLFAARSQGESEVIRPLLSPDSEKLLSALQKLGIRREGVKIYGGSFHQPAEALDLGNSGIGMRFLAAFAALDSIAVTLTGDASLSSRSMEDLLSGLKQLGVSVTSKGGFPPFTISGKLRGGKAVIEGRESQAVSALLMAAALAEGETELIVKDPGETAWVELTLSWLRRLHLPFRKEGYSRYYLPGRGEVAPFRYTVPGDFSTALFPLAAALMTRSTLHVDGLDFSDPQGDKAFIFLLKERGAKIDLHPNGFTVDGTSSFQGGEWDLGEMIDALPVAAVLGTRGESAVTLKNISLARIKECDRVFAMREELSKMGVRVEEKENEMTIYPGELKGASLSSFGDHRIAMALAVAAFAAKGESLLDDFSPHAKTFPEFIETFKACGAELVYGHSSDRAPLLG